MLGWYLGLSPRVRGWLSYVLLAATAMVLTGVLGFATGVASAPGESLPIREPVAGSPDLSATGLFVHNAEIAIRSALGIVTVGLYTVVVLLFNGFMIGAGVADAAEVHGLGPVLLALLPHGIFELPAIWLSGAVGLRWLTFAWKVASGDRNRIAGPWLVLESLALVLLALGLLLVAAYVEANVSAHLLY